MSPLQLTFPMLISLMLYIKDREPCFTRVFGIDLAYRSYCFTPHATMSNNDMPTMDKKRIAGMSSVRILRSGDDGEDDISVISDGVMTLAQRIRGQPRWKQFLNMLVSIATVVAIPIAVYKTWFTGGAAETAAPANLFYANNQDNLCNEYPLTTPAAFRNQQMYESAEECCKKE